MIATALFDSDVFAPQFPRKSMVLPVNIGVVATLKSMSSWSVIAEVNELGAGRRVRVVGTIDQTFVVYVQVERLDCKNK